MAGRTFRISLSSIPRRHHTRERETHKRTTPKPPRRGAGTGPPDQEQGEAGTGAAGTPGGRQPQGPRAGQRAHPNGKGRGEGGGACVCTGFGLALDCIKWVVVRPLQLPK